MKIGLMEVMDRKLRARRAHQGLEDLRTWLVKHGSWHHIPDLCRLGLIESLAELRRTERWCESMLNHIGEPFDVEGNRETARGGDAPAADATITERAADRNDPGAAPPGQPPPQAG